MRRPVLDPRTPARTATSAAWTPGGRGVGGSYVNPLGRAQSRSQQPRQQQQRQQGRHAVLPAPPVAAGAARVSATLPAPSAGAGAWPSVRGGTADRRVLVAAPHPQHAQHHHHHHHQQQQQQALEREEEEERARGDGLFNATLKKYAEVPLATPLPQAAEIEKRMQERAVQLAKHKSILAKVGS
jgi:hypothetical protein